MTRAGLEAGLLVPTSLPLSGRELYGGLFWTIYVVWLVSEVLVLSRRSAAGASARQADRGSVRILRVMVFLGLVSVFMSAVDARATALPDQRPIFFLGIALMLAGLLLRWWAVSVLGRFFTVDVAIHRSHSIIQIGPYRWVRHPAYTGSLLTLLGIGLALGTWLGLLLLLVFVGIGFAVRIRIEEAALVDALGEPYRAYMNRTDRLVPFLI